ncbi:MAG: DUF72 domain-containing protein [Nitrososphaerota archaeon]|nr:DUF72 domain-containing protein [Nitrososphaerota archaeon]MDG7027965.1 DUF72 domain-containing protein [Nitrososphaerota archaeon]
MSDLLIGTSGWSYNEWAGAFYPNSTTNKLAYYSKYYQTVEVDSSFYAFPSKRMVEGWARYTPERFVFSVKLPRQLTHDKRLDTGQGVEADLVRFLEALKPLIATGKLGPILVQLPPSYSYQSDFARLKGFFERAPEDIRFAVEFRHPSWLREEVWSYLRGRNVANVIVDEPLLPPDTVVTADFAFIRWHGRGNRPWYNYRYGDKELSNWVPKVEEVTARVKETYGYFNNHFKGFAVENSLKMLEKLGRSSSQQQGARERATKFIETGRRDEGEGSMLEFAGGGR